MSDGEPVVARMWEARVAPGRLDDAVRWLTAQVRPRVLAAGALEASVYAAPADSAAGQPDRVVLVTRWRGAPADVVPAEPSGVVLRSHAWDFQDVTPGPGGTVDP